VKGERKDSSLALNTIAADPHDPGPYINCYEIHRR